VRSCGVRVPGIRCQVPTPNTRHPRPALRANAAPIYDWFTEGFDTRDLIEAKALLEELEPLTTAGRFGPPAPPGANRVLASNIR
jgi:hypothetical protein